MEKDDSLMNRKKDAVRPGTVFGLVLMIAFLLSSGSGRAADRVDKVLILPFTIHAAQDLSFMREGILDMLGSRLAWEGRVQVLDKAVSKKAAAEIHGELTDDAARALASNNGADYILFGSMSVFGQAVSLDARIVGTDPKQQPLAVHAQVDKLDGVVARVNDFAGDINEKIFQRTPEARRSFAEQRTPAEYRRHPDTLLARTARTSAGLTYTGRGPLVGEGFWKSPAISEAVTGMDVGDVDGDGANEIVYSTINEIIVGRVENGSYRQITRFKGYTSDQFFTVDVGDVNGNGRAEIFVNSQRTYEIRSYVLEWTGSGLKPIVQDAGWFYRIIPSPSGPILVGQRSRGGEMLFDGPVYKMNPGRGGYVPGDTLSVPEDTGNALNIGLMKIQGEAQDSLLMVGTDGALHILGPGGQVLWEGGENYGGSVFYLKRLEGGSYSVTPERGVYYFLPPRIVVADADGDGQKEIIISTSEASTWSSALPDTRPLNKGEVRSQVYAQMSIQEIWHSPLMAGFPVDYQIKDYNNDGQPELIMAILVKNSKGLGLLGKAQSNLVAFSLTGLKTDQQKDTNR